MRFPIKNGMRSDRGSALAPARLLSGALPPIALGAVGMLIAFYPTLLSKFERMQSDTGDTRFTNFVLEYEYRWLHGDPLARELWSPGIFFPEKNTLAYSDTFVSLLPFYAPWRSLGAKPDSAYQLFLLTVGGLNFIVAYLLLRNGFRRTVVGSSLGAFLFSFGSIRLNQLNHAQLLPQFYPLISLYGLVRIFQADLGSSSRHFGWWIALFFSGITAQLYADYYLAWFYVFALGLCCVWVALNPAIRRSVLANLRPKWKFLAIGFAAWIVSVGPLATHYLKAAQRVGYRDFGQAKGMLPRFQSWFYVGSENWLCGWLERSRLFEALPMHWEHRLGLGLVTTAIFVYVLWHGRKTPLIRLLTFVCLAVVLLSTAYRGQLSPWAVVFQVIPGANGIRAVSRIAFLLLFPASYALASFAELALGPPLRRPLLVACIVSVLEQGRTQLSYDKQEVRREVEAVVRRVEPGRCAYFYYSTSDMTQPAYLPQVDAMFSYLATGIPTVNAYSSNAPRDWALEDPRIGSAADELRLAQRLDAWLESHRLSASGFCWIR